MVRWQKPIHYSSIIGWLSVGVIIGIAAAGWHALSLFAGWEWLLVASTLLFVAIVKHARWVVIIALASGMLVGAWRGSIEQINLAHYQAWYGKNITLQGTVSDDTVFGPHGDQRIMLNNIHIGTQAYGGQIWVSSESAVTIKRSDIVTLHGTVSPGFGGIAGSMFNASVAHVARPQPGDIGLHVRDWFARGIRAAIPEPEASLAAGYLVGQRSALPETLDSQLKAVGLTHAVVASGYNLTILVSFARQLLAGASKYLATLTGAGMIAVFMMVSGLSPSMTRAGLVTGLSLAAWYYGRKIHPLVLLPFAAAVTGLFNPSYVWGDIGWYLSFTSFAGVIMLAPLLQHYLWGNSRVGFIKQTLVDTTSAQLATLPIMIFAFGHYSPYALLANLLVLPLIPLTMALIFGAGIVGLLAPAAAHLCGAPATAILHYMTHIVAYIAGLPGAQGELSISAAVLGISYAVLGAFAIILWRKTKHDFRQAGEMTNLTEI